MSIEASKTKAKKPTLRQRKDAFPEGSEYVTTIHYSMIRFNLLINISRREIMFPRKKNETCNFPEHSKFH